MNIFNKNIIYTSFLLPILLFLFALFSASCATIKEKEPLDSELYSKGEKELSDNRLEQARLSFERLLNSYPDSKYRTSALLGLADTLYKQKNYLEARMQYQKFIQIYPVDNNIDKAQFFKGMCYFNEIKSVDRDQTNTQQALEQFDKIINLYPTSNYYDEALAKRDFCINRLAQHILYIGRFYYKTGKYHSVISRMNEFISRFPTSNIIDEAYYYLGMAFIKEENMERGIDALKTIINNYPESKFYTKAKDLVDELNSYIYN